MYDFLQVVNRHHSSKLLSFLRKSRFGILATDRLRDRRTDKQMDRPVAITRSRYRERQLNKATY